MKRFVLLLSILFCTTVFAHSIEWYVGDTLVSTTTCESGDNITPPTAPAKFGYSFVRWDGYTPIEYLEFTGTQWIDTGIAPGGKILSADLVFQYISNIGDNAAIIGSYVYDDIDNFQFGVFWGNWRTKISSFASSLANPDTTKKTVFINGTTGTFLNTIVISNTQYTIPNTNVNNLYLWRRNEPGGGGVISHAKIYSCKIYDNGIIVRDFIPVLDKNGTPCMYDKVEGKFFYNQGTGDFIAGPVIQ